MSSPYQDIKTGQTLLEVDLPRPGNLAFGDMQLSVFFKDIDNLEIILVPLIMILSRGHTGQIKG